MKTPVRANSLLFLALAGFTALAASAGEAPSAKWPFVILRSYGSYSNNVRWTERVFAAQERHPGLVNEIWFCADDGFATPEEAAALNARENLPARERCQKLGIDFSFQQGVTLNHNPDGVRRPGFPDDAWAVNRDGEIQYGLFCCTSPFVKDYMRRKAAAIMSVLKPGSYWPDDDMRLVKRNWARPYVCFCDHCLRLFNAEAKTAFTRETLLKALETEGAASAPVRRAWYAFNGRRLGELAATFREARDAASPATRLGIQICGVSVLYNGDACIRSMPEALAGPGGQAGLRPGGGYYYDATPRELLGKLGSVALSAATFGRNPACGQVCYEMENWPHIGAEKNPGAMMREAVLALSVGCDSIAFYWGADQNGQADEASDWWLETLARWRPQLERTRDLYRGTSLGGIALYQGDELLNATRTIRDDAVCPRLAANGFPMTVVPAAPDALCIDRDAVQTLSVADLPKLLSRPVLTDTDGFRALAQRFPALDVVTKLEARAFEEEKALATVLRESGYEVFPSGLRAEGVRARLYAKAPDVRGFSRLTTDPSAFGTVLVPSAFGGALIVAQSLAFERPPFKAALADGRRHAALDALDEAVPGGMPVRLLTDGYAVAVYYSKRPDGSVAGVTLFNLGCGETPPLKLAIRSKGGETVYDIPALVAQDVHVFAVPEPLPDENGTRAPVSIAPFPDRLSAFVWRNWTCVGRERLAEVVGAPVAEIEKIAAEMGLPPQGTIAPEWRRKGYITVLRRNWHLLDYPQLLRTVDMTREELRFRLKEDDFLWAKLGHMKPKCGPLRWRSEGDGGATAAAGRRAMAAILKEEGADDFSEEPRFSFIRSLSRSSPSARAPQPAQTSSPFDFRLIFSYFAEYGDPLGDPEVGSFPEGLLQKLAAEGVNAVWLHTVLSMLATDPKYPEFGVGAAARLANLQTLVDRAAKYGIRVFLYMNEPRYQQDAFFAKPGRAGLRGVRARDGTGWTMCTSVPETRRWVHDALKQVFSTVRGVGGIFTITMSENLTSCASCGQRTACPRCAARTTGEIVAEINAAMIAGMRAGDPKAEALVWNWAWPEEETAEIVRRLPREGVRVMGVSEGYMKFIRGGVEITESDYSISVVGPGPLAKSLWNEAKACGLKPVAKVQVNNSWELSPFPYLPVLDLVAEHAHNLARENVTGVMLSWSCGCCPAPNLSVYRDYAKGDASPEAVLNRLATRLYGDRAPQARKAWTAFSEGFRNFPFQIQCIYTGPQQWGPANPLYAKRTGYSPTMVGFPYDGLTVDGRTDGGTAKWTGLYPPEIWIDLMRRTADGFARGAQLMEGVETPKEVAMYRAEGLHFLSSADQGAFILARDRGDRAAMREFVRRELATAKAYLPLMRGDSRIGYECSNHYFAIPQDVREKIVLCRQMLAK